MSKTDPTSLDRRAFLAVAAAGATTAAAAPSLAAEPAVSPTAPTAKTLSPEKIDQAWRRAAAKFDAPRATVLKRARTMTEHGPFRADWPSLKAYEPPLWYQDAKFGIFIHWGVYSVPAFGGEWYSRLMYQEGSKEYEHHRATYGPQDRFGYKDFIPQFTAKAYDPAGWAKLFKQAGARYVVPVAEHHDGYAMYDTRLSDWTAVKTGPKRDLIGAFAKVARAEGLHFGLSSHRAEHDWFFDEGRKIPSDVNDPRYLELYGPAQLRMSGKDDADLYGDFTAVSQAWVDDWLARTAELVELYDPELIYFDWWIGKAEFRAALPAMLAQYYNTKAAQGRQGVVNYKLGSMPAGAGVLDIERGQAPGIQSTVWQTCTSISDKAWGFIENDTYKSAGQLIHLLIDVVSKNGNLLLNVGPHADGSIPAAARDTLLAMGQWLGVNGEAIYGSRPWRVFGEGPTEIADGSFQETKTKPYTAKDFRFTTREGRLYVLQLSAPEGDRALITTIKPSDRVQSVTALSTGRPVTFSQTAEGLQLAVGDQPAGQAAYVYRIELA
ncbi:alpha-L-fucosidase [Caulobacter sp. BK020]|uniref:alpha-L-fucosidase n=1 Tax=Caulobacter sp. BK020 TaxID=2512117 RepID=UPI0010470F47|nr:alpha-L-fucosidase [Caulobacter sp. BK020]TCS17507.1 alpha-L-fucosidase [Caulobacter sp. BK020]